MSFSETELSEVTSAEEDTRAPSDRWVDSTMESSSLSSLLLLTPPWEEFRLPCWSLLLSTLLSTPTSLSSTVDTSCGE